MGRPGDENLPVDLGCVCADRVCLLCADLHSVHCHCGTGPERGRRYLHLHQRRLPHHNYSIGVAAIFRKSRTLIIVWCVIMVIMFCIAALQMILFGADVGTIFPCRTGKCLVNPIDDDKYLRGSGEALYWFVLALYMTLTFFGFVSGVFFWIFAKSVDEDASNHYG